jgi:hypothetical protein
MARPKKFKDNVNSFLCFHNDINKNMLLANVVGFNILRKNDDDVNLRKMLSMTSTTDGTWIQHAQDRSWSASSSKSNIRFISSTVVLHWEGHISCIWRVIEVNKRLMEILFDKLSNRSGPHLNITSARSPNHHDMMLLFLPGAMSSPWACYSPLRPQPKLELSPTIWRTSQRCPRTSSPFSSATTLGDKQGRPSQIGGPIHVKFKSISGSRSSL